MRQEAVVADIDAPQELDRVEHQRLDPVVVLRVAEAQPQETILERAQAAVGDGDAMGVTRQVLEYLFGAGHGRLDEDHPLFGSQLSQPSVKAFRFAQWGASSPSSSSLPRSYARRTASSNLPRNKRLRGRTGKKNFLRHEIQRLPSSAMPPAGTTQCKWG